MNKNKVLSPLLFFLFLLVSFTGNSQSYYFKHLGVSNGLPFSHVYAITQSSDGVLWLGGYGGLASYDGYNVQVYSQKDSLPSAWVNELCIINGDLWGGTKNGLFYKSSNSPFKIVEYEGIKERPVQFVFPSFDSSSLWVGVDSSLFSVAVVSGEVVVKDYSPKGGDRITTIYDAGNDSVYVATSKTLLLYTEGKFVNVDWWPYNKIIINSIKCYDDKIYVCTKKGLVVVGGEEKQVYTAPKELPFPDIKDIVQISENRFWLATTFGIVEMKDGQFNQILISNDNSSNDIRDFYEDREGNIWIGTVNGMYQFSGSEFKNFSFKDGLSSDYIFDITQIDDGQILLATDGGGIVKYNHNEFKGFPSYSEITGKTVTAFTHLEDTLYIGSIHGLFYMPTSLEQPPKPIKAVKKRDIVSLFTDSKGRVWYGSQNTIGYLSGDSAVGVEYPDDTKFETWSFTEDRMGNIIIGTYGVGCLIYDGVTLSEFVPFSDVQTDNVLVTLMDGRGNIILGTFNGLFVFDSSRNLIGHLSEQNGLNSNFIYNLVFDKAGNLWIGTNRGVNKFDYLEFLESNSYQVQSFGFSEGFVGVENNCNGAFCDTKGRLWFGTVNGLMMYEEAKTVKNISDPVTVIENIKLFYLDTLIQDSAVLKYDENHVVFGFKGVNLTNPENTQYSFMLDGFEQDWSPVTKDRSAAYPNLPPGNYTFKVISTNAEGIWDESPATFNFKIEKPLWLKPWFIALESILVLGGIVFLFFYLTRRVRAKESIRRQMNELKLQSLRSQMNPHFLFNSLNSIQHYINNNEKRSANRYLTKFATLMRAILEQSRKQYVKVDEEVSWLKLYLDLETMRFEDRFNYEFEVSDEVKMANPKLPPMMLQPFIENALLHGFVDLPVKGHIKVSLKIKDNQLLCTIADNGIGLEKSMEKKQRQSGHNSAAMKITNTRIETLQKHLNAKIKVLVKPNQPNSQYPGTCVEIYLPLIV